MISGSSEVRYIGLSTIADSDGSVKSRMGDEEGVIVRDITLDPPVRHTIPKGRHGSVTGTPFVARLLIDISERMARRNYAHSPERRRRAVEISSVAAEKIR